MKRRDLRIAWMVLAMTGLIMEVAPASGGEKAPDLLIYSLPSYPNDVAVASPASAESVQESQGDNGSRRKRAAALFSLTLFGGVMTENEWEDFFTSDEIDFADSVLLGFAASRGIWRLGDSVGLEVEGQAVRHFGKQDHWEFNLPLVVRWHAFPWDAWLDTSVAVGIGPSWASKVPRVEAAEAGSSQRWMVYWLAEIEVGFSSSPWHGIVRLHHRSGAYGLVADEGGSNVLTFGVRRYW